MGDTDFPTVLGNRMASNPAGYLQQYVKGMEAGGPLIGNIESNIKKLKQRYGGLRGV